jgi:hypothetical protein
VNIARLGLATALAVALGGTAKAQIAILQIQVVEGEGAVHAPGARASHFLTVAVTDETGQPVEGAAVSFHLPEDGPSGTFANGLRTDVATSDSHGRAAIHTLTLNRVPGRFQMRIVAAKEQARAGIMSFQYIAEPAGGAAASTAAPSPRHRTRWIVVAALVGGGAAAALVAGHSGTAAASAPASVASASSASAPSLSLGNPTITVTHP